MRSELRPQRRNGGHYQRLSTKHAYEYAPLSAAAPHRSKLHDDGAEIIAPGRPLERQRRTIKADNKLVRKADDAGGEPVAKAHRPLRVRVRIRNGVASDDPTPAAIGARRCKPRLPSIDGVRWMNDTHGRREAQPNKNGGPRDSAISASLAHPWEEAR